MLRAPWRQCWEGVRLERTGFGEGSALEPPSSRPTFFPGHACSFKTLPLDPGCSLSELLSSSFFLPKNGMPCLNEESVCPEEKTVVHCVQPAKTAEELELEQLQAELAM